MELTGLAVIINGKEKFVGKVGVCPPSRQLPHLQGQAILYREVKYADVHSYRLDAYSVDVQAWNKAMEMGAASQVIYCKDSHLLIEITPDALARAFALDMGEAKQYRIKVGDPAVHEHPHASPLPLGYTDKVVKFNYEPTEIKRGSAAKPTYVQPSLFGD